MKLCANRPDGGFVGRTVITADPEGPYYRHGSVKVLTTCFIDSILISIGPWFFILFTIALMALFWSRRRETYPSRTDVLDNTKSRDAEGPPDSGRRTFNVNTNTTWSKTRRFFLVLTTFFIVALIAMHALVIARLSANQKGIGLLPFNFVPLLIVLISLYVPSPAWNEIVKRPARPHGLLWMAGVGVWSACMMVTEGLRLWSLSNVYNAIGERAYNGVDSQYLESDQFLDTIVIVAVYFAFYLGYVILMALEYRRFGDMFK